jgi:SagB-type dehydrogenase family enzyme
MFAVRGRRCFLGYLARGLMVVCGLIMYPAVSVKARSFWKKRGEEGPMPLPEPKTKGSISLEEAIRKRRTIRDFIAMPLTMQQLGQLLWAAQGITEDRGYKRAAPSAGALYPMDVYVAVGDDCVEGLKAGVYHYEAVANALRLIATGDRRRALSHAALHQNWMARAPVNLVITAEYKRISVKYGNRGVRYAMIEAGHIGQNLFLQAEALGLAAGIVGAFNDNEVVKTMEIPLSHEPLLVMPVGYKA